MAGVLRADALAVVRTLSSFSVVTHILEGLVVAALSREVSTDENRAAVAAICAVVGVGVAGLVMFAGMKPIFSSGVTISSSMERNFAAGGLVSIAAGEDGITNSVMIISVGLGLVSSGGVVSVGEDGVAVSVLWGVVRLVGGKTASSSAMDISCSMKLNISIGELVKIAEDGGGINEIGLLVGVSRRMLGSDDLKSHEIFGAAECRPAWTL